MKRLNWTRIILGLALSVTVILTLALLTFPLGIIFTLPQATAMMLFTMIMLFAALVIALWILALDQLRTKEVSHIV